MRAGILKEIIGIYKPVVRVNENGIGEEQNLLITVIKAAVFPIKSKELIQAGTELTQQMIRVVARPFVVTEKHKLEWLEESYEIIGITRTPEEVEILAKKVM